VCFHTVPNASQASQAITSNERTITSVLIRTLAIRLAVFLALTNLESLQGRPTRSRSFMYRRLLSTLEPHAPIFDLLASLFRHRHEPKTFRFSVLQLTGCCIPVTPEPSLTPEAPGDAFASSLDVRPLKMCHEDLVVKCGTSPGAKA